MATTRLTEAGWRDLGLYSLDARCDRRYSQSATYETLREATDAAIWCARNHRRAYRVREAGGSVIFTAHPDGSWSGRRDNGPEAPL